MRHTKIIATLGPASAADREIDALIGAGVDVFRINFSHGTHDDQQRMYEAVRAGAARAGRAVSVMQDLAGPKVRTGRLAKGLSVDLSTGAVFRIATGNFPGGAARVSTTHASLAKVVSSGDRLLLDDGRIELRVVDSDGSEIVTEVTHGGSLGERKGIHAPGVEFSHQALTDKDVEDLEFGLTLGVDFVAVSFVQSADDLCRVRDVAGRLGVRTLALVAKIERPQAVDRFDDILTAADAVMVARGDLGLEIPFEQVPRVQKDLTRRARARAIPVIVATQVLGTMRTEPRPTRAEVSDAANAVDEGVDAIMLAGETAIGSFPELAVRTLDAVIRDAESTPPLEVRPQPLGGPGHGQALCEAAVTLARNSAAAAIIPVTRGGTTAQQLAALRPRVPIHAVTDDAAVARRLTMYQGVAPVTVVAWQPEISALKRELLRRGILAEGDVIVCVRIHSDLNCPDANFVELRKL